jgi:hypothetical protein
LPGDQFRRPRGLHTLAVATLTGIVGLFASGFAASLAVNWYDVNAFEGAPQFFVACIALAGSLAGAVVGLAASLLVARRSSSDTSKALAVGPATILVLVGSLTGIARILADIPPKIDGEQLFLSVELRTPAGHASPTAMPGVGYLKLGATGLTGLRKQETGLLFPEDARYVSGRWVIPGVVHIFTSRGGRRIDAGIGTSSLAGFVIPLPGHPGTESREWSEWLPRSDVGEQRLDQFSYRYKVVRQSEPLRVESLGRFTVETVVSSFYRPRWTNRVAALSHFRVRYNGQPVPGIEILDSIAVVNGPRTVLLVEAEQPSDTAACHLLVDDNSQVDVRPFGKCEFPVVGRPLTSDPHRFAAARDRGTVAGWVDRETFETPGLYLIDGNVLDTRNLTFRSFELPPAFTPRGLPPPLMLAPDERSFAWFAHGPSQDTAPMLGVTEWKANRSYTVRVDRDRMRFIGFETLDPAWVDHHFEWRKGPDDVEVLVERSNFVPLPYRGQLTLRKPGEAQGYVLLPAGEPLRNEVVRMLVEELHGKRLSDDRDGRQRIRLDGKVVNVSLGSTLVAVTMDFGEADPEVMRKVAAHLDAAFTTGRYDSLFRISAQNKTP